jgi:hypothetical protein
MKRPDRKRLGRFVVHRVTHSSSGRIGVGAGRAGGSGTGTQKSRSKSPSDAPQERQPPPEGSESGLSEGVETGSREAVSGCRPRGGSRRYRIRCAPICGPEIGGGSREYQNGVNGRENRTQALFR